jgi:hypothetical protein
VKQSGERHLVGKAPAQPGAHALLAVRAMQHARALGLTKVTQKLSRVSGSSSNYVCVTDDLGREWTLRISEHVATRFAGAVHFDLVSRDGIAGLGWLEDSLALIATGNAAWFETAKTASTRPRKRRGRIMAANGKKLS